MRGARAIAALVFGLVSYAAEAQQRPLKVGVLTDMTGILSSALGTGSVDAARMAIADFGGEMFGRPIEFVYADHQNKPDIGATIVRRWFDEDGVDMIADIGNSAVALAVRELVVSKNRVALFVGASSSDLTGKACSPNTAQWSHDSYLFASALPKKLIAEGKKSWFLMVQDWAFGHALQRDVTANVQAAEGKVVGSVRHPAGSADYSSLLLQAQGSGANVVAFLSAVQDLSNSIKQAREFGVGRDGKQILVAPAFLLSDAHGVGLEAAQGITFSTVWYWNMNPAARAWSMGFFARNKFMPAEAHAGTYSAVSHYLKAVKAVGTTDPKAVMKQMRQEKVVDFFQDDAWLREDGRLMRRAYVAQMKSPSESKEPWDYYKLLTAIPPEEGFRPASERACPLDQK
ncbi:ABC transporter substrate-binding protein [Enterovirga rhinocerotis]|uniref:Branched-chain amino acid transport system substrate-binding protein n=1 Tax=Enterovirga rhinocerotis TaxID=1339210 RepID=A0A4R7BNJ3_9HYPH|nr:ABC transporter substrate-binding protein [Enterovirga rhinocerotis]TDR85516.1 branched-chain amino acid transport system substrate-binding protein [Enterovirga rhinocerotis]